ncbi:MAG: fibronectin type III domain-containing protein [Opitutaceae bacterium]|nr:fibronectin type III domain-containing protein [Opitutaceae bacterium]
MKPSLPALLLLGLLTSASAFAQVVIQSTTYPAGPTTVSAANTIETAPSATVIVPGTASVTYVADTSITLRPGFHATGGYFHAVIAQPPTAPPGFQSTATCSTFAVLEWGASSSSGGINHYEIYRNGALIATVGSGVLTYTDDTAQPDTTYTYTVRAVDNYGALSAESTLVLTTTPPLEVFNPLS